MLNYSNIHFSKEFDLSNLKGFTPQIIDDKYFANLGIDNIPENKILERFVYGSTLFVKRFNTNKLYPNNFTERDIDLSEHIEIHNYTGKCPTNTFEINPIKIGCNVGCFYCLVNDGEHFNEIVIFKNYHDYIQKHLLTQGERNVFYYFSPKSEAFQEPTLESGLAHKILLEFVKHFENKPDSKVRLFIATKASEKELYYKYKGITILDLLTKLKNYVQFNPSIGIYPEIIQKLIEPNAASVSDRLNASLICQQNGILSNSVLTQPIIGSFLTDKVLDGYFSLLSQYNIKNFKPEFLTVSIENLALICQIIGWYDKKMEKNLLNLYIAPENQNHIKQRKRLAPDRIWSANTIDWLKNKASNYGISLSICYWVREQLGISESVLPLINANGYQCLGYQTKLFEK